MSKLDVSCLDGDFCVVDRNRQSFPIRLGGAAVRSFQPGWRPTGACDSFAPWTVLDLIHESGREASWLLDGAMEHRSGSLRKLPEPEQLTLAAQAAPSLRAVHEAMLCAVVPGLPPEMALFEGLNRDTVRDIVGMATDQAIGRTRVVELHRGFPDPDGCEACLRDGNPARLNAVGACLDGNFQEALQAALVDGYLTCASPVDGIPLRSRDSLVLHEHRIAYRFVDERHGLVFYVGTTSHFFAKADLFIPAINTVFVARPEMKDLSTLAQEFLTHFIVEAVPLLAYLAKPGPGPNRRFAVICRGYPNLHIGHHVWNELTALDRLVREIPPALLPMVIVPNPTEGSEVFAPIDRIFPELEGKVDRTLHNPEMLGNFVYQRGYCLFRALDERVTLELAQRIRTAAAEEWPSRDDERLAARIQAEKLPCVLFGLRLENRTVTDPAGMLIESIEQLRQRLGQVVVIIDGHNARLHHDPACVYDSFGQDGHEPPVFASLRLVVQLRRHFENTSVEIVNLCGASMSRSLFWCQCSDFFVASWGAGLAKYRWICNRPGLVLSNRWNLRQRADLDIYHAPRYQEGGTALHFVDPADVTDMPDAPLLFSPVRDASYNNFRIDPAGLRRELDAMITTYLP